MWQRVQPDSYRALLPLRTSYTGRLGGKNIAALAPCCKKTTLTQTWPCKRIYPHHHHHHHSLLPSHSLGESGFAEISNCSNQPIIMRRFDATLADINSDETGHLISLSELSGKRKEDAVHELRTYLWTNRWPHPPPPNLPSTWFSVKSADLQRWLHVLGCTPVISASSRCITCMYFNIKMPPRIKVLPLQPSTVAAL